MLTVTAITEAMQGNTFWQDSTSNAARIVAEATRRGFIRRASHTQVEWTDAGLAKARAELPERSAPKFYDVRLSGGPLVLCSACVAVLVQEGTVAGDPREEAVPAHEVVRMAPRAVLPSDAKPPTCDTCASREAYEEALNESRAEDDDSARRFVAGYLQPHPCEDTAFGTPEEHARWHEVHDTPTFREVEGEAIPWPGFGVGTDIDG